MEICVYLLFLSTAISVFDLLPLSKARYYSCGKFSSDYLSDRKKEMAIPISSNPSAPYTSRARERPIRRTTAWALCAVKNHPQLSTAASNERIPARANSPKMK